TAYFLIKAFPERRVSLFGEAELSAESLETFDMILMPSFELPKMPERSVDTTFSAYTLPDLPAEAQRSYITDIQRQTLGFFVHMASDLGTARLRHNIPKQ